MSGFTARRIEEPFGAILLENRESGAQAIVLPDLGATLWKLRLPIQGTGSGKRDGLASAVELLESDSDTNELLENPGFRGRILVPFNDRIPNGRYRFNGSPYQLPINEPADRSAIHGLVHDKQFGVCTVSAKSQYAETTLEFLPANNQCTGYPFDLRVRVVYRLEAFRLETTISVTNESRAPAPVTMGMHPYFLLDREFTNNTLFCPGDSYVEVDQQLLPTGAHVPIGESHYDYRDYSQLRPPLDIAIRRPDRPRTHTVIGRAHDRIIVEQDTTPFAYTQLFLAGSSASLAIEPVTAATNAFNIPELGLTALAPGETLSGSMRFSRSSKGIPLETGCSAPPPTD